MIQWERYDVDMLLDIADSTNAPDENREWYCEEMFDAKDGWKVSIFYDCGELDYIDHFMAPDGEVINFWEWPDTYLPNGDYDHDHRHPRNRLMAWRGVRRPETEEEKARREFMATLSREERLALYVATVSRMAEAQQEVMRGMQEAIYARFLGELDAANAWLEARNAELEAFVRGQEKV